MRSQHDLVILIISFLFMEKCINISQEYLTGMMNSSATACNLWDSILSDGTKMDAYIHIHQRCFKRSFVLHPIMGNNVFLPVYHNEIDCVIDLLKYWEMENSVFITDSHSGITTEDFRTYLKLRFTDAAFEVISLDSTLNLEEIIKATSETFFHFATICDHHNTNKILHAAKSNNLFNTNHRWIIVSQALPQILKTTIISVETQVTLISPRTVDEGDVSETFIHCQNDSQFSVEMGKSSEFFIYDIFYSYQTKQVELIKFAHWTEKNMLYVLENFDSRDRQLRLRGRLIKMGAFIQSPYIQLRMINGTVHYSGFSTEIIEMLTTYFNVNYSTSVYEPIWGGITQNGSFTGALGTVHRKEIDIAMNLFIPATFRSKAALFLAPVAKVDMSLIYETPPSSISPTTYLLPFSGGVWLCISFGFASILVTLAVAMCLSPGWKSAEIPSGSLHTDTFRLLTGTFFDEALTDPPGSTAKVLYGTLLMATLAVFTFYTSVFVSFLTYREMEMPIRNLKDLADSNEYTGVTVESTFYDGTLRLAQTGLFKELWTKLEKTEAFSMQPTLGDAIQTVYRGKNVLLFDGTQSIVQTNNNCSITLLRTGVIRENLYIVARHDFPYNRMLRLRLMRIKEGGLLNRLDIKYSTQSRPPCDEPETSLTFGIHQVVGLFFVLTCGMLLSFAIFFVEKLYSKRTQMKIRKTKC